MQGFDSKANKDRQEAIANRQQEMKRRVYAIDAEIRALLEQTVPTTDPRFDTLKKESHEIAAEFETLGKELKTLRELEELYLFTQTVSEVVKKVTQYRPFVKELIDEHRPEVTACLRDLVNVLFDVADDLKPEQRRLLKMRAVMLYEYFGELKAAGFDTKEALQIILSQGSGSGLTNFFASAGKAFGDAAGKAKR
jgi:hypothetical protein